MFAALGANKVIEFLVTEMRSVRLSIISEAKNGQNGNQVIF
jgi:hypothetical protein